jgi:NADPH-dependent 2,4-dienoyl-CoA reductase/sulfur reductase-like enzyme
MRILVIGGVAAGMSAAAAAKRHDEKHEVVVFERGEHISYGACGLPYFLSNKEQKPEELIALTPDKALSKKGVIVNIRSEVMRIDTKNRKLEVAGTRDNSKSEHSYDRLIIATGASPVRPEAPGIDNKKVFFLKTLNDGIKLKDFMHKNKPKSVVIIGAGHIGLEAAEAFKLCGITEITMAAKGAHLCWWLDKDMADMVEKKAAEEKIHIIKEAQLRSIEDKGNQVAVNTSVGVFTADFAFISQGMKPNSALAKDAGIKLGARNSIAVNNFMETSAGGVYAAGDCADVYNIVEKERIYMPRGTTANKQGRFAGVNAAGGSLEMKGITGSLVFKFFDLEIGRTGMWEEEAARKKIEVRSALIKSVTRAGYYPGGYRIFVKLTADKKSGKFLGGQIIGGEGVAKRIDILSTALYNGMAIEEMRQLDLSYAPPFSPVWDPVLIAINSLCKNQD